MKKVCTSWVDGLPKKQWRMLKTKWHPSARCQANSLPWKTCDVLGSKLLCQKKTCLQRDQVLRELLAARVHESPQLLTLQCVLATKHNCVSNKPQHVLLAVSCIYLLDVDINIAEMAGQPLKTATPKRAPPVQLSQDLPSAPVGWFRLNNQGQSHQRCPHQWERCEAQSTEELNDTLEMPPPCSVLEGLHLTFLFLHLLHNGNFLPR